MTEDEFTSLWAPACANVFGTRMFDHNHFSCKKMDELLGVKEFETFTKSLSDTDKPMDPELRRKVALLAGPHWRTVLKANNIPIPKVKHDKA